MRNIPGYHLKQLLFTSQLPIERKFNIPAVFFTASSIIETRALLPTHRFASTGCVLLTGLVFTVSNSFPN